MEFDEFGGPFFGRMEMDLVDDDGRSGVSEGEGSEGEG